MKIKLKVNLSPKLALNFLLSETEKWLINNLENSKQDLA